MSDKDGFHQTIQLETMDEAKKKTCRWCGSDLEQQILARSAEPGALVAEVALSHGINGHAVLNWRRQAVGALPARKAPSFVPVTLAPAEHPAVRDIRIELRRGATSESP